MLGSTISTVALRVALLGVVGVRGSDSTYDVNAGCNNDQLMRWFDTGRGLWKNNQGSYFWWQSANALTAFNDLVKLVPSVASHYSYVWDDIYNHAPANNPNPHQVVLADGSLSKAYTFPSKAEVARRQMSKRAEVGFVNEYYDDEGWWALGFAGAWDITRKIQYLDEAIGLWYNMHDAWGKHHCGGIPWNKLGAGPNSIANELYIALGAALSNRVGADQKNIYLDGAKQGWDWFQKSGVINSANLIMDGVDANTCQPGGITYTYNQGVIIGGLVEMYTATGNSSYLDAASKIADAVTRPGSPLQDSQGILGDDCDIHKTCTSGYSDGTQFKGVFMRNLKQLQAVRPSAQYKTFLQRNAQTLWAKDTSVQNGGCYNGVMWGGPYVNADASAQSSALDCLNAAFAVSK